MNIIKFQKVLEKILNTLRPRQNGRHFPEDIFKCIFLNENVGISIKISLKFVQKVPINNIPALVQIMAGRRPGDKSLSWTVMVSLLTQICVTRPQWVKLLHTTCWIFMSAWLSLNDPEEKWHQWFFKMVQNVHGQCWCQCFNELRAWL